MKIEINIENDLKSAVKNGDKNIRDVLRMLISDVKNVKIEKKRELTDEEVLQIVKQNVKRRKDSIEQYTKGKRIDLADKESQELSILQKYMPKQMSEDEIQKIVKEVFKGFKEISSSDFGKIIGLTMKDIKAVADGNTVSRIVKEEMDKVLLK
ncbi:MAG: GatB/YqeY domain-containing protein [Candidatus Pacebacteria bacterium]|nr:GatB/YqeY domain-containing protein [Candidatus Paceibacterota bacterium]